MSSYPVLPLTLCVTVQKHSRHVFWTSSYLVLSLTCCIKVWKHLWLVINTPALALLDSPCNSPATPRPPARFALKLACDSPALRYVYQIVMMTPCSEDDHALERPASVGTTRREFYPELFHRLPADTYRKIIIHLKDTFIYSGSPVASWSGNVSSPANIPNSLPPNRPLGALIKVQGGVGLGQVTFEDVTFGHQGIFRNP